MEDAAPAAFWRRGSTLIDVQKAGVDGPPARAGSRMTR